MKRPLSITILSLLLIVMGVVGFFYHLKELVLSDPLSNDAVLVLLVRLLAVAAGILVFRGSNLGRWLSIIWMAYHVILSFFHPALELLIHLGFLALFLFVFFHPKVRVFFRTKRSSLVDP
jgi:hypothetical protein